MEGIGGRGNGEIEKRSILSCFHGKEWRQEMLERWRQQAGAPILIGILAYLKMLRGYTEWLGDLDVEAPVWKV